MVEAFVQQHPDLKEELDSLLQYKLVPDTGIVFEGKEDLLKENGHSYHSQQLRRMVVALYRQWIEQWADSACWSFLAAHPAAQKKWPYYSKQNCIRKILYSVTKSPCTGRKKRLAVYLYGDGGLLLRYWFFALGISSVILLNRNAAGGSKKSDVAKQTAPEIQQKATHQTNR